MEVCAHPAQLAENLPTYASGMAAFHRGFADELQRMVRDLPLERSCRLLDLASGDGTYLKLFSVDSRVESVTGIDIDETYVAAARDNTRFLENVRIETGNALALPFDDLSFDFVWCAQSLYSLPEPRSVLREVKRVLRRGGRAAIFENDSFHHLLLPWPIGLELALKQAEYEAFGEEKADPDRCYLARDLPRICRSAELTVEEVKTYSYNRSPPLKPDEALYLDWYLRSLKEQIKPYLSPRRLEQFERLTDASDEFSFLNSSDTVITFLDYVAVCRKE